MAGTKAELLDKLWTRMSERGDFPILSQALRTTVSAMSDDELDFSSLVQIVLSDVGLTQKGCTSPTRPCTSPSAAISPVSHAR